MEYSKSYRRGSGRGRAGRRRRSRSSNVVGERPYDAVESSAIPEPVPSYTRPSSHVHGVYFADGESRPTERPQSYEQAAPRPSYTRYNETTTTTTISDSEEDLSPRIRDTRGGHRNRDLLLRSQGLMDTRDPEIRDYMTICVYHNTTKRFDACTVPLTTSRPGSNGKIKILRSDRRFFQDLRVQYRENLTHWWGRLFGFKTVDTVRMIHYGDESFRPFESESELFSPKFMKVFQAPEQYLEPNSSAWVQWLAKQKTKEESLDVAIELKQDYDMMRIMAAAGFVLMSILLLSAVWLIKGGDAAYVSSVMSFVLAFVAAVSGLTGLWESFDKGSANE